MKIVHLTNNVFDGAGKAAYALHDALRQSGEDSLMLVYRKIDTDPSVIQICDGHPIHSLSDLFRENFKFVQFVFRKIFWELISLRWQVKGFINFQIAFTSIEQLTPYIKDADVICLYSVQSFLSPKLVNEIYEVSKAKIVWTPMDMEPITGGCHFDQGCSRYQQQCKECPQIKFKGKNDLSKKIFFDKMKYLKDVPIHFVAVSKWMRQFIEKSALFGHHDVSTIMLGLDKNIFKPGDQKLARQKLNLPQNDKIILFGCFDIQNRRKGGFYLIESLRSIRDELFKTNSELPYPVTLVTFGGNEQGFYPEDLRNHFNWIHLGPINDVQTMALAYQSADVYACPSMDDIGPRAVIDSFRSNLPVVAFNQFVAKELINCEKDGELIQQYDVLNFGRGLVKYMSNDLNGYEYSEQSLNLKEACTVSYQADAYRKLFKTLIANDKASIKREVSVN